LGFLTVLGGFIHQDLPFNQELGDFVPARRAGDRRFGGSPGKQVMVVLTRENFSRVDASQYFQPWLDLIASGAASLDPKERWDGVIGPVFGGVLRLTGSVLWSGKAAGYHKASLFVSLASMWNLSLTLFYACLGEQRPTVVGMKIRDLNLKDPWVKTFGTIDGGLELMNAAWPAMRQVFAVR
jgi:hypothetical protein